jgi:hypothetical protein
MRIKINLDIYPFGLILHSGAPKNEKKNISNNRSEAKVQGTD